MRLRALAKINLGLDILGKREDGYHEVRMIMQTIQMYDVLEMKKKKIPGISLAVNYPFIPSDERNLVYKAAKLLMDEFQVEEGVSIHLDKFIPVAAGMAGGSSGRDQSSVQAGTYGEGSDGARGEYRGRCSLLRNAGNCPGRRNRRETYKDRPYATVLCAGRETGN